MLSTLGNTMALLRRCRVNAALTIQLFSQLFHYINMGVFNMLVMPGSVNYCSRSVLTVGRFGRLTSRQNGGKVLNIGGGGEVIVCLVLVKMLVFHAYL